MKLLWIGHVEHILHGSIEKGRTTSPSCPGASKLTISYRVASKLTVENHRNMLPAPIHEAAQKCIVNSYSGHGKDEGKAVLARSTSLSA